MWAFCPFVVILLLVQSSEATDVLIIGAGVAGIGAARQLVNQGHNVTVGQEPHWRQNLDRLWCFSWCSWWDSPDTLRHLSCDEHSNNGVRVSRVLRSWVPKLSFLYFLFSFFLFFFSKTMSTERRHLAGVEVDLGASWIHGARPGHPIKDLADKFGLDTVEMRWDHKSVFRSDGRPVNLPLATLETSRVCILSSAQTVWKTRPVTSHASEIT